MTSLSRYYADTEKCERVRSIIDGTSCMSLRLIEWFVNTFAKRHGVLGADGTDVYSSYRAQLKTYTKQNFDPFRRHERITFVCDTIRIETTVGQLNFFRWALQNSVLDYIVAHRQKIEGEMLFTGGVVEVDKSSERQVVHESPQSRVQPSFVASIRRGRATVTFD